MISHGRYRGAARALALAAGMGGGALLAATAAGAQEVTLRLHTFAPPGSTPVETFLEPWAEAVGKASGGRLAVQVFPAMQLGGEAAQLLDQVRDGAVDIVWALPGFTPGRMPRAEPFELPFVHRDTVSTVLALQDYQDRHLGPDLEGYRPLLLHAHAGFLFQARRPVRTLADLEGVKMRAASRSGVWLLESVGASGTLLPLSAIPPALRGGVIDGAMLDYDIAPAIGMQDLVHNFSTLSGPRPRLGTSVFAFLMNPERYEGLPPELRKAIDANAGRNIAREAAENWARREEAGRAAIGSAAGSAFHVIAPEETAKIEAAAAPVFERWYAEMDKLGIDGRALVADARALIDGYADRRSGGDTAR